MSSMNELLASHFTNAAAAAAPEALEKQAQSELFCKLAAQNGIDLSTLSEEKIAFLWNETFNKEAEFPPAKAEDKKKDEEHEKAKEEHEKKKEAAAKLAEAEVVGRYMAHAMVDEIRKIASASSQPGAPATTTEPPAGETKEAGMPDALRRGLARAGKHLEDTGKAAVRTVGRTGGAEQAMHPGTAKGIGAAVHGAAAAAAGGAAYGAKKLHDKAKEKKSSAIDTLAAEEAVVKAASCGWDAEQAAARIGAILTLGVEESVKIAHVEDLQTAVGIRSLELLEAAGYPVTWEQG